jgi:hypothetical protein
LQILEEDLAEPWKRCQKLDELSAVRVDRILEELPEPSWKNHGRACRTLES